MYIGLSRNLFLLNQTKKNVLVHNSPFFLAHRLGVISFMLDSLIVISFSSYEQVSIDLPNPLTVALTRHEIHVRSLPKLKSNFISARSSLLLVGGENTCKVLL
jgi:hypothetical protein